MELPIGKFLDTHEASEYHRLKKQVDDIRKKEENKFIPVGVIDSMIESYDPPSMDEGYDFIIKI